MQKPFFHPLCALRAAALALAIAAAAPCIARAGVVELNQDLPAVKYGWNAVYVELSPTNDLDGVFGDWPTDSVGLYDPAAFLATRQYSATSESQGMAIAPIAMWHRGQPAATEAVSLPANTVCIFFSTNTAATHLKLHGVPAAPRTTWHVTSAKKPYNFFGLSLQDGAGTTVGDILDGFPGINSLSGIYRIFGTNAAVAPALTRIYATTKLYDANVLLVPSSEISDWSGVLNVSPMDGLDYGTNATLRVLSVRNDGTQRRTAAIDLVPSVSAEGARDLLPALHLRDTAVAVTNAAWVAPASPRLASKVLEPGETWKLEVGLDRSLFDDDVRGTPFGAVLRITDDGGASKWRVDVPLQGAASGKTSDEDAWPGGLWIAEAAFDEIHFAGDTAEAYTPAGGTLKVRMPMHVDGEGTLRLLQRVVVAGSTAADGSFAYTLYAGDAAVPATARETMRISSAVLPTEQPVIPLKGGDFRQGLAIFSFTVDADGATSLLRHPTHPQHDGLRWDFSTPAPSGDDFDNYKSTVKPELFSVGNIISFRLDLNGGEAPWNPEEEKTGTCTWTLENLRREGPIAIKGPMTIRRIAPQTDIVLE
jgi:hypothetical protein